MFFGLCVRPAHHICDARQGLRLGAVAGCALYVLVMFLVGHWSVCRNHSAARYKISLLGSCSGLGFLYRARPPLSDIFDGLYDSDIVN
jgi:hypothetical protein